MWKETQKTSGYRGRNHILDSLNHHFHLCHEAALSYACLRQESSLSSPPANEGRQTKVSDERCMCWTCIQRYLVVSFKLCQWLHDQILTSWRSGMLPASWSSLFSAASTSIWRDCCCNWAGAVIWDCGEFAGIISLLCFHADRASGACMVGLITPLRPVLQTVGGRSWWPCTYLHCSGAHSPTCHPKERLWEEYWHDMLFDMDPAQRFWQSWLWYLSS